MAVAMAALELSTPPSRASQPWKLGAGQWALLALFIGVLGAICWATWNGPGSLPREATVMNRTFWSSMLVAMVTLVLLKARRYQLSAARWQPVIAWCVVGFTVAHILFSVPVLDWIFDNSRLTRGGNSVPITLALWLGLAVVGLIPRTRRYFFSTTTVVLLIWVTGTAFTKPQVAYAGLPFLALMCALLAGGQRKWLSVLAWGLVLAVFALTPKVDTTRLVLYAMSSTGVLGLLMFMLHGLPQQGSVPAMSADARNEQSAFAVPGWVLPASIASGFVSGFAYWLIAAPAESSPAHLQLGLLISVLAGALAFVGLYGWSAARSRREQNHTFDQLQGVLDASQTAYSLWRADGSFVWANRANLALMGGSQSGRVQVSLFELPMYKGHVSQQATERLLADGEIQRVQYFGPSFFGVDLELLATFSRVTVKDEHLILAEYEDLRAERAAQRKAQEQLQGVLDASDTAFSLWTADGRFVWCNRANLELTGDTLEQHQAINLYGHPGLAPHEPQKLIRQVLDEDAKEQVEFQVTMPSGAQVDVRATLSRVMLADEPHLLLQKVDLTQEHAREQALNAYLSAIDAQLIVHRTDANGRIVYVNDAYLAYSGYRRDELLGQSEWILRDASTSPQVIEDFKNDLAQRQVARRDLWKNRSKLGEERWCSLVAVRLPPNADGQIETLTLRTDLTEMVKANRAAQDSRVQAQTERLLSERKDEFVAAVSHELRTPLNGILGMLQGMERTIHDDKTLGMLGNARRASQQLLAQVNDILDFSRLRDGKLELHPAPVRVQQMFDSVQRIMQPLADEQGLALRIETEACAQALVQLDAHRVSQVLINLLSNGIKFTPRGAVFLRARCSPTADERVQITIEVADTGIGMSAQFLPQLFDRFSQADTQDSGARKGTGLGMAITKALVEQMGGSIEVVSELGKGTTFTVKLSAALASAEQIDSLHENENENENEEERLSGLRVLYADDDRLNRLVVQTLLDGTGVLLELVNDGQQAVDRVLAPDARFDLVLMDLQMPNLDGLQATRKIREHYGPRELPIIGLSAHALSAHREQAGKAGMTGFLTKPVLREALLSALLTPAPKGGISSPENASDTPEQLQTASTGIFDTDRMLRQVGGNAEFASTLLKVFLQESPQVLLELAEAVAQADGVRVRERAHLLKGQAGAVAADALLRACEALEKAAYAGELDRCSGLLQTLKADYRATDSELRAWLQAQAVVNTLRTRAQ